MKKLFLLPIICLLLAGCQPDDDVDMPEPEPHGPINELIQGKWLYAAGTSDVPYYFDDTRPDSVANDGFFFVPPIYSEDRDIPASFGNYTLDENGGKAYLTLTDYGSDYQGTYTKYSIKTISDETMTWEKESGSGPATMEFKKEITDDIPQAPTDELLDGSWYAIATIPDLYPNSSPTFPDSYSFYEDEFLDVYNESYGEGSQFIYSLSGNSISYYARYPGEGEADDGYDCDCDGDGYDDSDGGYCACDGDDGDEEEEIYSFEIISISDITMVLEVPYDYDDSDNDYLTLILIKQ